MCYVHDSPIHGRGLIAARDLPARASLGELVGERITAAEFAKRKAAGGAGGACLVRFTDLDGAEVNLDGEGRCLVGGGAREQRPRHRSARERSQSREQSQAAFYLTELYNSVVQACSASLAPRQGATAYTPATNC